MTCGWCAHDVYHPYIISSTLYIFYHVQLSFHTLSTQMHIVHVICMWSAHVHIICLSSLTLLVYPIIHNLVSAHCLHTHIVHVICMLSTHVHVICLSSLMLLVYPIIHNWVSIHCLHTHILLMWSVYCLQMYMLYTSHLHYSCQVSRTTTDNVHLICICPDSMQMTCTYTDNSSRDDMYITYAFLNSTICGN